VALSKVQDSTLRVITYLDVGLVVALLVLISALAVARWVILSRRLRRQANGRIRAMA
jgi:hypothetical protein